ncbi:Ovarian tumor [Macleaya cordata]|uniref:Ubiquitin thioesterase OTU n=1 Tax=Macleaya cordata TaxID=56857 RepID=A0A200QBK3_MACCD|nr:Ovarian tumor [Macleaya cordata]
MVTKIRGNVGTASWLQGGGSGGVISGLWVCFSNLRPLYAEATEEENNEEDDCGLSLNSYSHGKIVYTDYSVIDIPGDGRCLFRSVAHGACLQSGKPSPNESLERELADELRDRVADEFMRRRGETEWFVEGDFDTYISQIKKPHAWGGEPELFMCSHVLQMPITVYLYDEEAGGLIAIAESLGRRIVFQVLSIYTTTHNKAEMNGFGVSVPKNVDMKCNFAVWLPVYRQIYDHSDNKTIKRKIPHNSSWSSLKLVIAVDVKIRCMAISLSSWSSTLHKEVATYKRYLNESGT